MLNILILAAAVAFAPPAQGGDQTPTILQALQLPALITAARDAGVPESVVRQALDFLGQSGVPAEDAALVIREEVDAVRAGAPRENFGAFVHQRQAEGLRGRALAEAIRAEHRARGIGRPDDQPERGRDNGRSRGRNP